MERAWTRTQAAANVRNHDNESFTEVEACWA